MRKLSRSLVLAMIVGATTLGTAGAALADAGKFVKNNDGSIVFYPYTSGNARGKDFKVSGSQALCADGPTSAPQNFVTQYRRNRSLSTDVTERSLAPAYSDSRKCSSSFSASNSNTYHLDINWSNASGASSAVNGVTEHSP